MAPLSFRVFSGSIGAVGAILIGASLLSAAGSLASCTKSEPETAAITGKQAGGTLRLPLDTDALTLDPIHITDVRSKAVARQIYSTLVRFDKDLRLVPDLAESWDVSPDGLRFIFHLRKGAKFHNGREVTAEDFVNSFTRLADPAEASQRANLLRDVAGYQEFREGKADNLAGISAPERYKLQIDLLKPYSPFLSTLAMINFAVVPTEAVGAAEEKSQDRSRHPIGSGPFRLADWQIGSSIRLEANADYYKGAPYLEAVLYKVMPDVKAQFKAYADGELDATNIPVGKLREVVNDEAYRRQFHHKDLVAIQFYVFNMDKEPWHDRLFSSKKTLRQAMNYAINREYIAEEILEGRCEPLIGIIPPALTEWYNPAINDEPRYRYNVDEARKLLEVSGHPQGMFFPQKMRLLYDDFSVHPDVTVQIEDFFRDVSVKGKPLAMDSSAFLKKMQEGDFIVARGGCAADYPDPDALLWRMLASENAGAYGNWARWRNDEFDTLVEQARAELNPGKRRLLYWQAERIALEEAPWLFLFTQTANILLKPEVRGIEISGMDIDASFPNNDLSRVYIAGTDAN